MRVFLIGSSELLFIIAKAIKPVIENSVIISEESSTALEDLKTIGFQPVHGQLTDPSTYSSLDFNQVSGIILIEDDSKKLKKIVGIINEKKSPETPVIVALKDNLVRRKKNLTIDDYISIPQLISKDFSFELKRFKKRKRLMDLFSTVEDSDSLLILTHDNPDPDSIASAMALEFLLKKEKKIKTTLAYGGFIGRTENRTMLELLNIKMKNMSELSLDKFNKFALIETSPGKNNSLPSHIVPDIIIDHHPYTGKTEAKFLDIRPDVGANATIMTEYFIYSKYTMKKELATALLYAIKCDTLFLNRETHPEDIGAFIYLYPLADINLLQKIQRPAISIEAFDAFGKAVNNRTIYKNTLFSNIGLVNDREIFPQIAEFCLDIKNINFAVIYGLVNGSIVVSIRNSDGKKDAGKIIKSALSDIGSAGGHRSMAAAIIKKSAIVSNNKKAKDLDSLIIKRFLKVLS
ncbi:MAG: hypothetical protein A2149_04900 [Candidatus Schekmanbacteria bacterium RBG_16_38_11]|uniref:DDH domain-containing protein n=1 Tax=Candidatus Schekmanbacteria bacterium RBG_16_38_11 TaxID=1817880 RepID=A0A1F7RSP0_9BACT|nr:MAG: hypothetical protein A2149_04900 [Candidatus Schekmanbacteria bacterium RBG_16_38_11]